MVEQDGGLYFNADLPSGKGIYLISNCTSPPIKITPNENFDCKQTISDLFVSSYLILAFVVHGNYIYFTNELRSVNIHTGTSEILAATNRLDVLLPYGKSGNIQYSDAVSSDWY